MNQAALDFLGQARPPRFFDDLEQVYRLFPEDRALVYGSQVMSYAELRAVEDRMLRFLAGQGIGAGSRVLLMLPNCPELVWIWLALLRLKTLTAPCELRMAAEAAGELAADFEPCFIVCHEGVRDKAERISGRLAASPRIIELACDGRGPWDSAGGNAEAERPAHGTEAGPGEDGPGSGEEPVAVHYQLDRADRWRGALFGTAALSASTQLFRQLFALHRGDAVLCQMSSAHHSVLGCMILPALCSGGILLLLDRSWEDETVLDLIEEYRPKLTVNYRKYYWYLHRSALARLESGRPPGRLQHAVVNTDSPVLPFRESWEELFGGHLLSGYASYLAAGFLTLNLPWLFHKEQFVGKPLPGVELRIVDESGHERPSGRWGEIVCRSARMAMGFVRDDPSNPERFGPEELRTQQMAMRDTDGYLTLADEIFDVIWVNGFKISPLEVEEPMLELRGIRDVAAVNANRQTSPDRIQVFVLQDEGGGEAERWTAEGLLGAAAGIFPEYLRPAQVTFVDEIPYDDEGFKLRKQLKYRYQSAQAWRTN